jgi:hypothetical protein
MGCMGWINLNGRRFIGWSRYKRYYCLILTNGWGYLRWSCITKCRFSYKSDCWWSYWWSSLIKSLICSRWGCWVLRWSSCSSGSCLEKCRILNTTKVGLIRRKSSNYLGWLFFIRSDDSYRSNTFHLHILIFE